ncbi:MAG: serine protease AprX [Acidobacteriota bacterium]|jgi:serine protease AprX|nr:serine protease AprX [Acidobacteriota bacterium]
MFKKIFTTIVATLIICTALTAQAATLSQTLKTKLAGASDATQVGLVIIAFKTDSSGLKVAHFDLLRGVGIKGGYTLQQLGMVAAPATAGQVRALAANSSVRSIWSNDKLYYFDNQARTLVGLDKLRADTNMTRINGGLAVSGRGDFSVVINDSGIDATHEDLKLGSRVIQNVQILSDPSTGTTCTEQTGCVIPDGFTPLLFVENVPNTDTHVGHGTHCAGIVGGSGIRSAGQYAGVAPGAKLIGTGSGAGLFILNALGGYEYSLAKQFDHAIRVISNSWGSSGPFEPDNPINIATKKAYDLNIISVFAAGNEGPGPDTHNPYAKAPWVISVAAGTKEGGLASFSSRGLPREERLNDSDPLNDNDAPSITAPGTGREFDSNVGKFTTDIISTRATSNVVANGMISGSAVATDVDEIPAAYLPYYTEISGTSMATPHVAGVVALMLDADSSLTPDEVKQILQQTATRMPGRADYEVGAGYVNAYAAVDKVFNRSKAYGATANPTFNSDLTVTYGTPETFTLDPYIPQPPGPQSTNTHHFTVAPGIGLLDVRIDFGTTPVTDETGNSMGMALYPPGCTPSASDPSAVPPCAYSNPPALPGIDSPRRENLVKNPVPGEWIVEVRGLRGLAAAPVSSPVGIALPERVDGLIKQAVVTVEEPSDIQSHPAAGQIRSALANRMMDTFSDNTFRPDTLVIRSDFARALALNTPLRQSVGATAKFTDVSGELRAMAEAVTASGSTLRDWNYAPAGMMSAQGALFNPNGTVSRLDLAVAFVRALGLDTEAKAKANTPVKDPQTGLDVIDNGQIPGNLRGYVQIAVDKGFLEVYQASAEVTPTGSILAKPGPRVEPGEGLTRATLAAKLNLFAQRFVAGN